MMNREQLLLDRIAEGFSESLGRLLETAEEVNGGEPPQGEWWDRARELAACPAPDNTAQYSPVEPSAWLQRLTHNLERRLRSSSQFGALVGALAGLAVVAPLLLL